jgi:hypothetical protein
MPHSLALLVLIEQIYRASRDYEVKWIPSLLTTIMIFFFLALIFCLLSIFFGTELLKKFWFWKQFEMHHTNKIEYIYHGDRTPGMYTIELHSTESFRGLIGFDFSLGTIKKDLFDVFGYIQSWEDHTIRISTYLGHRGVKFIFLIDGSDANSIEIHVSENQNQKPNYIFRPHWYQKIWFYG